MRFEAGVIRPWPGFELVLEQPLDLQEGRSYHLKGANGSGKSSFLTQVLIPRYLENPSSQYLLYFQQQMHLQSFAIRAAASLANYQRALIAEEDYIRYLLDDLDQALLREERPVVALIDESSHLEYIVEHLSSISPILTVYWVDHHRRLDSRQHSIHFETISSTQALVYEKLS